MAVHDNLAAHGARTLAPAMTTGTAGRAMSPGRECAWVEACFRSGDYREGQRAFAEKRPPAFTGR